MENYHDEHKLEQIFHQLLHVETRLIRQEERFNQKMAALDDALLTLTTAVQADTDAENAALTFIAGIPDLIKAAVTEALAAGATPEQLKAVTDAATTVSTNAAAIKAAILANTPSGPPATGPVTLKP